MPRASGTSAAWWVSASMRWTRCYEDPNLTDNPTLPGKNEYGDQNQERKYNDKLPEVLQALAGLAHSGERIQCGADWRDLDG